MRLALDTNRYTDLMKRVPEVVQTVEDALEVVVSFAVLAELRAGFLAGSRAAANERILKRFLSKPTVRVFFADHATTDIYAALFVQLRHAGRMIPQNDLWIAALCVQHGLTLYSRDAHFDHLPQVPRV